MFVSRIFFAVFAAVCIQYVHCKQLNPSVDPVEAFYVNDKPPPGTLIMIMVIKNEAINLKNTLPRWAKIIDHWVIGIDDANSDDSEAVIQKYIGHIPGELVTIHFDGMGPAYTKLAKKGWELFPQATHGIMVDADYAPMVDSFNRSALDIGANKILFKLYTEGKSGKTYRKMDWIYRNTPDVYVRRRTHQELVVPPLANQTYIRVAEIDLPIIETGPGYQDREMSVAGKLLRYAKFLEADLEDMPNDPMTMYFLGDSYQGVFEEAQKAGKLEKKHWDYLEQAVYWYKRRAQLEGFYEQRFFAFQSLGNIYERYYSQIETAFKYYRRAHKIDPERIDPLFYIGQRYSLEGDYAKAIPYLRRACHTPVPERSIYLWLALYKCVARVEFARATWLESQKRQNENRNPLARSLLKDAIEAAKLALASEDSCRDHLPEDSMLLPAEQSLKGLKEALKHRAVKTDNQSSENSRPSTTNKQKSARSATRTKSSTKHFSRNTRIERDISTHTDALSPLEQAHVGKVELNLPETPVLESVMSLGELVSLWKQILTKYSDPDNLDDKAKESHFNYEIEHQDHELEDFHRGFTRTPEGIMHRHVWSFEQLLGRHVGDIPCRDYRLVVLNYARFCQSSTGQNLIRQQAESYQKQLQELLQLVAQDSCFPYKVIHD